MPEFMLNTPPSPAEIHTAAAYGYKPAAKPHPFYSLDEFARGYVEAMFFTNGDTGDEREDLLNEMGVEHLTRAAVEAIRATCDRFLAAPMPDGRTAAEWIDDAPGELEQAGRDFWFTRQGHGVGFWSRDDDVWPEETRDALDAAARTFGESCVEVWQGWIHVR
jgi:hypothetical protein